MIIALRRFPVCTEICVQSYINAPGNSNYKAVDAFSKLIVLVIKFSTPRDQQNISQNPQLILLNKVLLVVAQVLLWHESTAEKQAAEIGNSSTQQISAYQQMFSPKPYFRIFVSLMEDLTSPALVGGSSTEVILQFATALHAIGAGCSWFRIFLARIDIAPFICPKTFDF